VVSEDGATGVVAPGGTVSTGGDATTAENLVITSVTSPQGGEVSVQEQSSEGQTPTAGYALLGQAIVISAPDGTVDEPLALTFRLHASLLPAGENLETLSVQRNGTLVAASCTGEGRADPDPCMSSRVMDGDDLVLTVLTSRASTWTFVAPKPGGLAAACPAIADSGFGDVPADGAHTQAIGCLRQLGITKGASGGGYDPAGTVSRGQMAGFVARMLTGAGYELDASAPGAFTDVAGSVHQQAIDALAQAGIVKGLTSTRYGVEVPVTRAQMATMMERAYGLLGGAGGLDAPDAFTDDNGYVHEKAIDRLALLGIAGGTGGGSFSPDRDVQRDQMASFLTRLVSRLVAEGAVPAPTA
jgi:hypothetical protein